MDIDHEWEILPDDGYLDFNDVSENHQIQFLGKRNNRVVDDYFTTEAAPWNHHHHVPIIQLLEPRIVVNNKATDGDDDDETVSHNVFFSKKNKIDHQFVEMKMDRCCSPKYVSRGLLVSPPPTPPPPSPSPSPSSIIEIDDGGDEVKSPRRMMMMNKKKDEEESSSDGELNIWKWGMNGVGAIFSFGVAAATICVFFFGTAHHRNTIQHHKIRFQIYTDTDDKRLTQVVQNANKLNEAISAIRGVPLSRAHITYGGYYDPFDL
ncbi:hypothetical protein PIB30_024522 [Stylosanthes scabra]|uniref:DUF6821 domain-containing protein n=1 Tax=Stylosanthes scabra TaxID=79078 RepID=A0ABU6QAB9_9FABA|nr:hypothetical protein [Stylosanthes scabra]